MSFWQTKTLKEMTIEEWESLCDGCGKCCLHKLEDERTGELHFTQIACRLLDLKSCRCTNYQERTQLIADCINLNTNFSDYSWLPNSCAYRLIYEGRPLFNWHPLLSGKRDSVQKAGVSVSSYAIKADKKTNPKNHIIRWLD
ncbi:MAG: YcgN family cysteine cluster protein [Methylococcaceae bacterium]